MASIAATEANNYAALKALMVAFLADITALRAKSGILTASATWDAGSIADEALESKDITVTGAVIGDFAVASLSVDSVDLTVTAAVTAADTVTVTIANLTGSAVDLASATVKVRVFASTAPAALTVTA